MSIGTIDLYMELTDGWLKHNFLHVTLDIQFLGLQMPRADIFGEIWSNVQFRNTAYIL